MHSDPADGRAGENKIGHVVGHKKKKTMTTKRKKERKKGIIDLI